MSEAVVPKARVQGVPVRWRIFAFLFAFGFLAYLQQKTITVAADSLMPRLGLTHSEIGWLEQAFVWGYALCQLPGGIIGQRLGARRTFIIITFVAFLATIATPIVPYLFSGRPLYFALYAAQFGLGCAQGAIFPVSAGVFESWFPARRWSLVQGLQTMALGLGAALTPPLITNLTAAVGWQSALLWTSLPALALIAGWAWYGRNSPREHPDVTPEEIEHIGAQPKTDANISLRQLLGLLRDRNVVLLFVSYMAMNYTFYMLSNWVFLYLREERHFSSIESGWLATAPPLAAAIGAGVGGLVTGIAIGRLGNAWGYRLVPLIAMPAAALLLLIAIHASNAYLALGVLAACFGTIELTEGAFWGAAMNVGQADTMAVGGFMNTGGNAGGLIANPILGYLSGAHAWNTAFLIGIGFAVVSALCWLAIRVSDVGKSHA
jgi:ACS family glucarate transporter-like MFS transporter